MASEIKLKLAIEGGQVVGAVLDGVGSALDGVDNKARAASAGADTLRTTLAAIGTVGTALALIRMADATTTLRTSLRLASNSATEAAVAYERLFTIAQNARVSFTELGATYGTIARAGNELGVSQDRLLTVTQAIGYAMTIGGGSAQSMNAALVQLGQGLGSGTLRGEELNSILEQTPRLARALADGMGVSIGQLRSLGEQGKLTAETVISALEKSAPQLAKEMANSTVTVGQAFTMLTNSATKFIGEADAASGASSTLAGALQGVAGAVDSVGKTINEHKVAFGAIAAGLAGAAVVAGLAAAAANIGLVTGAVAALGAVLMANPITLAIAAIVAGGMALKSLADSAAKSENGLGYAITNLDEKIARSEAQRSALSDKGYNGLAATEAKRLDLMKTERSRLYGELAVLQDQANASSNAKEMKGFQEKIAAEQAAYAGAKPLDEVRKMAKLRNDVVQQGYDEAVELAKGYSKAIANASSPEQAVSLEKERNARMIASAQETTAALKSYDDQKAAPAKEAAKERLTVVIAGYEQEQLAVTSAEQRNLESLSAAHALGLESDRSYIAAKQAIAADANIDQQAVVELELQAVHRSGLALKDRIEQENKYNLELKKLREQAIGIVKKADEEIAAADMKVFRAAVDQNAGYIESQQAKATSLEEQVKAQRIANGEIGLTTVEVNKLRSATMELAAAEKERQAADLETKFQDPARIQALRDQAKAMRELIVVNTDGVEKSAALESFKGAWASVDQTARGVFTNVLQGGQDAFTKLRDTLKATLLDLLYQMTVRKWVFEIFANVTGAGSSGMAGAIMGNSGGQSGVGGLSSASSLYSMGSMFSSGTTGLSWMSSGGFASNVGTGIGNIGSYMMGSSSEAVSSLGESLTASSSAIGSAASSIGTGLGYLSAAIAASRGEWGRAIGAGLGTYFFGPIGGAIGGMIGGAVDKAFGGGSEYSVAHGVRLQVAQGNLSTQNFNQWRNDGSSGFFGIGGAAASTGFNYSQTDSKLAAQLSDTYKFLQKQTGDFATSIGLSAEHVKNATADITVNLAGLSADEAKKKLQDTFTDLIAGMTLGYADALAPFQKTSETTADTLARLAVDLTSVNKGLDLLGYAMLPVSVASAGAAAGLVDAFGSLDAMNQSVATYYDTMYSEGEKAARASDSLGTQFAKLGFAVPTTEAEFRRLVSTIDITADGGATLAASVMALAPAFQQAEAAARAAANNLLSALQNYGTSAEVRDFQVNQIGDALRNAGISVDNATIAGGTREQYRAAYESFVAQGNTRAADALMAQQQAFANITKAAGQVTALGSGVGSSGGVGGGSGSDSGLSDWQRATQAIVDTMKDLRMTMLGSGPDSFAKLQAQFAIEKAQAKAGDLAAAQDLPELAKSLVSASKNFYRTSVEQSLFTARVIESLGDVAGVPSAGAMLSVPHFAAGGVHSGGWAIMGEEGPELAYMPSARIYNARDTRSMLGGGSEAASNSEVVTVLRYVLEVLGEIATSAGSVATSSGQAAAVLVAATKGKPLRTKEVA